MLQILIKGGWIMVPLGLCSVIALAIIIEKFITLGAIERKSDRFISTMQEILKSNDDDNKKINRIIALCEMTPSPLARILQAGIKKKGREKTEIKEAIQDAGSSEVPYLERHPSRE